MTKECMIKATSLYDAMAEIQNFKDTLTTFDRIGVNRFALTITPITGVETKNGIIAGISINKEFLSYLEKKLDADFVKIEQEFKELTPKQGEDN